MRVNRIFASGKDVRAIPSLAAPGNRAKTISALNVVRQCPIPLHALASGVLLMPVVIPAQSPTVAASAEAVSEPRPDCLPVPVSGDNFSELREHSPFVRTLNISKSLILTGIARIEEETVATMLDLETRKSYVVSRKTNAEGWQLVELKGDLSDLETLTAQIKVAGAEVVSIRYEKAPPPVKGRSGGVAVSTRIGRGPGGGTGPHGGPDPRVLTPDQLADARNAARNIKAGFQADGYADNQTIPPEVVAKISRLSVQQRENVNVKMFEYRNRGLGMKERTQIYNKLLDRDVGQR